MCERVFRGNIIYSTELGELTLVKGGYIVVEGEKVVGVYDELPEKYKNSRLFDYGDKLIIPGFVDLHIHAPQFSNRGLGLDTELLNWLGKYTYGEESKYSNLEYADMAYRDFVNALFRSGTTRSVIFATIYRESTELLMELIAKAGLSAFVGKLNMDMNSADYYVEDTKKSLMETEEFILMNTNKHRLVKPIITPRFAVSCSRHLLSGIGKLSEKYSIPVQSHLSENKEEIDFVGKLHPYSNSYVDVYGDNSLLGVQNTVMAHCVWSDDHEMDVLKKTNTTVAHCPISNANISSGIAPVRKFLDRDINVGLGTDVSGGHSIFMPHTIALAAQMSKMRTVYVDSEEEALSTRELFYMATKGGGRFFGKVGSFEKGYEFDALVIDDEDLRDPNERTLEERLQRFLYLGDHRNIVDVFVSGNRALGL